MTQVYNIEFAKGQGACLLFMIQLIADIDCQQILIRLTLTRL
jgi:hypothetical protein